jgi:hypothetical protein
MKGRVVSRLNRCSLTVLFSADGEAPEEAEGFVGAGQMFVERRPANPVSLSADYDGPLSRLEADLGRFLGAESVRPASAPDGAELVPSLLSTIGANTVIDIWKSAAAQARLTLAVRSVFRAFNVELPDELAGKTVTWLRIHAGERAFSSALKVRCRFCERTSVLDAIGTILSRPHEFCFLDGLTHHRHRGRSNFFSNRNPSRLELRKPN